MRRAEIDALYPLESMSDQDLIALEKQLLEEREHRDYSASIWAKFEPRVLKGLKFFTVVFFIALFAKTISIYSLHFASDRPNLFSALFAYAFVFGGGIIVGMMIWSPLEEQVRHFYRRASLAIDRWFYLFLVVISVVSPLLPNVGTATPLVMSGTNWRIVTKNDSKLVRGQMQHEDVLAVCHSFGPGWRLINSGQITELEPLLKTHFRRSRIWTSEIHHEDPSMIRTLEFTKQRELRPVLTYRAARQNALIICVEGEGPARM